MWGTFLSEPLRIVALVGRHPANQLMRRMPIRARIAPLTARPCGRAAYGVLGRISPVYPPGTGRLHTCYSPVRRSPAAHCCAPLPLDLHVLSLSLAFILSQDQTLRCCIAFLFFFTGKKRATNAVPTRQTVCRFRTLPVSKYKEPNGEAWLPVLSCTTLSLLQAFQ